MNEIAYMIERSAKYYADQTALICNEQLMSFKQVHENSNALGRGLANLGVKKGERVAILLPNCSEYVIADFALIKGGYVRVPVNNRLKKGEIEHILKDSSATALIYSAEFNQLVNELKDGLPSLKFFIVAGEPIQGELSYQQLIDENDHSNFSIPVTNEDLFQILYTSGTTGKPKGAVTNVRSRKAALNNVFIDELVITPEDAILHVASLAHGGGTKVLPHFIKGAANIFMPKFSADLFFEHVERYKVTTSWMVPTMIAILLESEKIKTSDFSSLKNIVYAAAPMPVTLLKRAIEAFGNIFIQVYGLSEAPNPDLVLSKYDHTVGLFERPSILRSAGREVTNVRVRIVDENGKDVEEGQVGEIIISGDNIMTEYWNLPEATQETIRDGWLYTGDMAIMDETGYVYIIDRQKDMIISGGYNIYPREIEEVLYKHPEIMEAAVIGIPDDKWGETVKACIVVREGSSLNAKDIIEYCETYLANYKKPKVVEFYHELPKNSNGKIQKKSLRDKHWQGAERNVN